jgi:hypothetical protein
MIRHQVRVLPPKKENIVISSLFVNQERCKNFSIYKKNIKIPKQDYMSIGLQITNLDNYHSLDIDCPNLCAKVDLLKENGEIFKKNFKILEDNGFIIEPSKINLETITLAINLIKNEQIIDAIVVDIV